MLFTDAITWNGKHSYRDFGLTVRKPSGDIPAMQKNEVRVPYQQGSYIFSYAYDSRGTYSRRVMTFEFNIEGTDPEDIYRKRTEVIEWLTSSQGGELRLDSIPDAYFKDVYVTIKSFNNTIRRTLSTITAEFTAYPFIISDYTNPQYYTATTTFTEKKYISTIERKVIPAFTATTTKTIQIGNSYYTIPANSKRYQLTNIKFSHGENTFKLIGTGELLIETFREVL